MAIHFVFIVVIAYVLGKFMEKVLPSKGKIGKVLNPHSVRVTPPFVQYSGLYSAIWIPHITPLFQPLRVFLVHAAVHADTRLCVNLVVS
jgi:hypothetical protein